MLTLTEVGMLLYWGFAALVLAGVFYVSPEYMYPDHKNATVVAWNWSFLPLDLLFVATGLGARFARISRARADALGLVSLAFMFCAGLMAVSFWSIVGFFDPVWWSMNLWLCLLSATALYLRFWRSAPR